MPPFQQLTYSSKSGRTVKSSTRAQKARETIKIAISGNAVAPPTTPQPATNPTNPRQYVQTYISQQGGGSPAGGGGGGGGAPPNSGTPPSSTPASSGGTQQQSTGATPGQRKALRKVGRRAADVIGDKLRAGMERISEVPSGDIGILLVILFFFMFTIYRVDFEGKYTRLQLILFTLLNQASLQDDPKKLLTFQPSQGGSLPASQSPAQPLENISNQILSQAGVPKVSQPPRVTRVPPAANPNSSETST